jgi:hypothetical protein
VDSADSGIHRVIDGAGLAGRRTSGTNQQGNTRDATPLNSESLFTTHAIIPGFIESIDNNAGIIYFSFSSANSYVER